MARRTYNTNLRCNHPGCGETTFFESTSQQERTELERRYQRQPWLCTKHARPGRVLRMDNPALQETLTASRVGTLPGLFWVPGGGGKARSGFLNGPGFCAHADDFPEGTRLVVTAYVETPEQAFVAAEIDAAGEQR